MNSNVQKILDFPAKVTLDGENSVRFHSVEDGHSPVVRVATKIISCHEIFGYFVAPLLIEMYVKRTTWGFFVVTTVEDAITFFLPSAFHHLTSNWCHHARTRWCS